MEESVLHIKFGRPYKADNPFAANARYLQSWYRVQVLNETKYGFGPEKSSKTKYGNILENGEITGRNFLSPEIFAYAQYRCRFLKKGETISQYRLFNNMLSSQPMCFNLFYPLKALFEKDHLAAAKVFRAIFPSLQISGIVAIEIEYFPYPKTEYLNDLTAFDAMLIYTNQAGERNILAIETKYVEKLGSNSSLDTTKQTELVNASLMFNESGKKKVTSGFGQLGRNFLLAEKFRIVNRLDKAFAVVISPEGNDSSKREIADFHSIMNTDFHERLFHVSLETMIDQLKNTLPNAFLPWMEDFNRRYLGFAECDAEFIEYKKA